MSRIGFFCFLGRGHLDPAAGLGRQLTARGHQVTIFHLGIAAAAVRSAGLGFHDIDRQEAAAAPSPPSRRFAWQDTVDAVHRHACRVLREGRDAARAERIDALVVDQLDVAAGSVAGSLGLPFVTLCCAPPMYLHARSPSPFFGWRESSSPLGLLRNRVGNRLVSQAARPLLRTVNRRRREWGMPALRGVNDTFSTLGILTQLPRALDFPERLAGARLFHLGPLRDPTLSPLRAVFPWHRLHGRRLIYASMGTIRNRQPVAFRTIVRAAALFDAQLVLSLGGGPVQADDLGPLPADTIVVPYAPQAELIRLASLVVNCAGLNTTLDAVRSGVPLVAIPVAEDQPGVAARIERAGIGVVVPYRRLSITALATAIDRVFAECRFREAAAAMQRQLAGRDSAAEAAVLVEALFASQGVSPAGAPLAEVQWP